MNNQMKLINQSVELYKQDDFTLKGIYKAIEYAGRCCYNSYGKITKDSYKDFIEMLRKNKHYSPFSFGTVHLFIPKDIRIFKYIQNTVTKKLFTNVTIDEFFRTVGWSKVSELGNYWIVTTNARVLEEYEIIELKDQIHTQKLWDYVKPHITNIRRNLFEDRYFVKCITSIAMSRELNRYTSLSIAERSTRYVKVDTIIKPYWYNTAEKCSRVVFDRAVENSIMEYELLLDFNQQKQQARDVLPLSTMTEVCYCGFADDWDWVIKQRTGKGAHPQMKELVEMIKNEIYAYDEKQ